MNVFQSQARQFEAALSDPDLPPAAVRDLLPLFQRVHASIEECLDLEDWHNAELLNYLEEIESALQSGDVDTARDLLRKVQPLFDRKHLRDSETKRTYQPSLADWRFLPSWLSTPAILGAASLLVLTTLLFWQSKGGDEKNLVQKPAAAEPAAEPDSPPATALIPVSGAALKNDRQPIK
jgi:hypothetical protein